MSTDPSGWVDPAAPGANIGRRGAFEAGESPLGRLQRAVVRFNASEATHTVRGLIRTLGEPRASIGAAAGSPSEARITVAWELCWYQWGVNLADDRRPVSPIAHGKEVEQLDGSARQWNASVGPDGRIALGVPTAASVRAGKPVQ